MNHENIVEIKVPDLVSTGETVHEIKIDASVYVPNTYWEKPFYKHCLTYRIKGKRKWHNCPDRILELVPAKEIQQAYLELWEKLKPIVNEKK